MNSQYGKKLSDYPKVDDFSQADRESFIGSALIHAIGKKDGATNYSDGNLTLVDLKSEQIQSDWNESDSANPAYIKNKPSIPDVSDMATKTWVGEQGYLSSIPSQYITDTELAEALSSKMNSTESSAFYPMATNPSGYLTQHQSLDGYATEEFVYSQTSGKMSKITAGTDLVIDGSVIKVDTNGTASGRFSFVAGNNCRAIGDFSFSTGEETSAVGEGSHTEGLGTIAEDKSMHAGGQYNDTTSGVLFVIGNGYYDEDDNLVRSDAFKVDMDGYASATILGTSGIGDLEAYIRYLEGRIYALEQEAGVTVPTVNGFSPTVNGIVPTV